MVKKNAMGLCGNNGNTPAVQATYSTGTPAEAFPVTATSSTCGIYVVRVRQTMAFAIEPSPLCNRYESNNSTHTTPVVFPPYGSSSALNVLDYAGRVPIKHHIYYPPERMEGRWVERKDCSMQVLSEYPHSRTIEANDEWREHEGRMRG